MLEENVVEALIWCLAPVLKQQDSPASRVKLQVGQTFTPPAIFVSSTCCEATLKTLKTQILKPINVKFYVPFSFFLHWQQQQLLSACVSDNNKKLIASWSFLRHGAIYQMQLWWSKTDFGFTQTTNQKHFHPSWAADSESSSTCQETQTSRTTFMIGPDVVRQTVTHQYLAEPVSCDQVFGEVRAC